MTLALSIQQPWAALIIAGIKPVENRTWSTRHRGALLIHAGRASDPAAMDRMARGQHPVTRQPWAVPDLAMQFGGIIGMVDLVDCVSHHTSEWFAGPYAFVLANPRALPFTPWRGMLGLFEVAMSAPEPWIPDINQAELF